MFQFKKIRDPENQYDTSDVTFECHAISLPEILEDFKNFLAASGFYIHPSAELILKQPGGDDVSDTYVEHYLNLDMMEKEEPVWDWLEDDAPGNNFIDNEDAEVSKVGWATYEEQDK